MYLKIVNKFLTGILFSRDEYNVGSKHFNPLRVIVVLILVGNLIFTVYLIRHIVTIHDRLKEVCPSVLVAAEKK